MAQYYTGTAADGDALYQAIRTGLLANGWTAHDILSDSAGSRDIVFRSTPIDATALNYCYLRMRWGVSSANYFSWNTYTDWDTTSHTGTHENSSSGNQSYMSGWSNLQYHFRVNQFAVAGVFIYNGTWYKFYEGFLRRGLHPSKAGLTRTTAAYAAGVQTVNVASDMTTKLIVGQKVLIYNHGHNSGSANWGNAEWHTIQSIAAGSITFQSTLGSGFDAGAVIGENPHPAMACYMTNFSNDYYYFYGYTGLCPNGVYNGSTAHQNRAYYTLLSDASYNDPSEWSGELAGGVMSVSISVSGLTGFVGYCYNMESCDGQGVIKGDNVTDGVNAYLALVTSTTASILLGPL